MAVIIKIVIKGNIAVIKLIPRVFLQHTNNFGCCAVFGAKHVKLDYRDVLARDSSFLRRPSVLLVSSVIQDEVRISVRPRAGGSHGGLSPAFQ